MGKSKIDMYTKYVNDFGFEDVNSFLTAGKSTQGLLVCEKSKALLYRIYPALKNFPKAEKHALCAEIKNGFYALISNINSASSVPSLRKKYGQEADGHLQTLKVMIELAYKQKYIGTGFYLEIDQELTEINLLLSGFIRSASKRTKK